MTENTAREHQAIRDFLFTEFRPNPLLSDYVAGYWMIENAQPNRPHRILPDACTNILFLNAYDSPHQLEVMGPLRTASVISLPVGRFAGVRFRPGMSKIFTNVRGAEIVDSQIRLNDVWGRDANRLAETMVELQSGSDLINVLEVSLLDRLGQQRNSSDPSAIQRALNHLEEVNGQIRVDDLARQCGLSNRQFLRLCLDLTGMTPKQLCRILRLKNAAASILSRNGMGLAHVAQECGYYDQAHFINDFRELAGLSPSEYRASAD